MQKQIYAEETTEKSLKLENDMLDLTKKISSHQKKCP